MLQHFGQYKEFILARATRLRDKLDELPEDLQLPMLEEHPHFDMKLARLLADMLAAGSIQPLFRNLSPASFRAIEDACMDFLARQVALHRTGLRQAALRTNLEGLLKEHAEALQRRKYEAFPG